MAHSGLGLVYTRQGHKQQRTGVNTSEQGLWVPHQPRCDMIKNLMAIIHLLQSSTVSSLCFHSLPTLCGSSSGLTATPGWIAFLVDFLYPHSSIRHLWNNFCDAQVRRLPCTCIPYAEHVNHTTAVHFLSL